MAKVKLTPDTHTDEPAPAQALTLGVIHESEDGIECAAVTIEPKRSRVIVLAPPPDDPEGYRVWLQTEAIPKLHHLPVDQFAERLSRIVHEHEEKMGARIAYHAGRIKGRLLQGHAHGHEKDLDAISRMAGVTTADKHAGIQTIPTVPDL
jgi:hypothetical protein